MTNTEQLRKNMLDKIKELFQLDQPDLDFGFYRIMHSRAKEITEFIEHDLLDTIKGAFDSGEVESSKTEFDAAKAKVIDAIGDDAFDANGALNPAYANSKAGKEFLAAQQKLADSSTMLSGEDSVYYHLYKFFSRYYNNGDFVSMRYHTRETDGMAKPYAVPYGGEEVMLHWANQDQYYIKTSENFKNFSFDLTKAKLFESMSREERVLAGIPDHALTVHFRIVEAEEGEHGNIKADPNKKREFFLAPGNPVVLNPSGELEVHFEYRQAEDADAVTPEDEVLVKELYGAKNKGDFALLAMTAKIIAACKNIPGTADFLTVMEYACPTEAVKKRILLSKYLYQYTARNTSDYFIHKNLRRFLRREMDFYIKNEIMNLDDIENTSVAGVENYLILLKVFRKIAGKLIDFLGQLEDFQKKLWLKKKFVTQCDYCITLDRVPERFYDEIIRNRQQWEEWERLGLITDADFNDPTNRREQTFERLDFICNGIEYTAETFGKESRITINNKFHEIKSIHQDTLWVEAVDFFKTYRGLMVDTKFFGADFTMRLLAEIPDLDEQCDGLLIHSENFQALNLLQERYREQVKCIYIDPPYNTGDDGFSYKDAYKSSSWMSMFYDRLKLTFPYMNSQGLFACHMDEHEHLALEYLVKSIFCKQGDLGKLIWDKKNPKGDATGVAVQHEYVHFASNAPEHLKQNPDAFLRKKPNAPAMLAMADRLIKKAKGTTDSVRDEFSSWVKKSDFSNGEKAYSFIDDNGDVFRTVSMAWPIKKKAPDDYFIPLVHPATHKPCPIPARGWRNPPETMRQLLVQGRIVFGINENTQPTRKYLLKENLTENIPSLYYMGGSDDKLFSDLKLQFDNPKPIAVGEYFIAAMTRIDKAPVIMDFFAGSGTTAHAVINLNREDAGKRKYILVEMGNYFDTVLKPRLQKVVFSPDWKDGKPTTFDKGVSHCFKYMTLESYEDTLNNLVMPEDGTSKHMPSALKEDYMLHYLLDTEARESLLNVKDFANPFGGYQLNVKQSDSDASVATAVDLIETFNYLIGLRIQQYYRIQSYTAEFKRSADPELPNNGAGMQTRLELATRPELEKDGKWRFQKIEGYIPANPLNPNDGQRKKVLILWRTLTGDLERDNLILDWYLGDSINLNEKRAEYDIIYVNGSNTLGADRKESDSYQVRLIEEEFLKKMWSGEEV